jgi:hypothetical protein
LTGSASLNVDHAGWAAVFTAESGFFSAARLRRLLPVFPAGHGGRLVASPEFEALADGFLTRGRLLL